MSIAPPDAEDLRRYLRADADLLDDIELADVLADALEQQAAACRTEPYTASLHRAALRRAARSLAAQGAALGVLDMGAMGASPVPRWDALIEAGEARHRRAPIGGSTAAP